MPARVILCGALIALLMFPLAVFAGQHPGPDTAGSAGPVVKTASAGMPMQAGQEMFATISEIVRILEASPDTDWSRVNIPALRKHLIDMNEVALHARTKIARIPGGVRIRVTGRGRTLPAIHRMLAMHARTMNGRFGWHVRAEPLGDGDLLTVTSHDPGEVAKIRGLGFMGVMVYGTHHGMHHLAIARGDMAY